jgi:hypothetical protein
MIAAVMGQTATVSELGRLGAALNAKTAVRPAATPRAFAFRRSCHAGARTRPVVLYVLQDGVTALMSAIINQHTATAAELMRLGADVNATDNVRVSWGRTSVTAALRVQQRWTALMFAAFYGITTTAADLVRHGADLNARNNVRIRQLPTCDLTACVWAGGLDRP